MSTAELDQDLHEDLLAFAATDDDGTPTEEGNELLRLWSAIPERATEAMRHHFDLWLDNSLGSRLTELVRLAVANQTKCPVCLDIRNPRARRDGVDEELIAAIPDPDRERFSQRERAAIAYATRLAGDHLSITPATYQELRGHFEEAELAELTMLASSFLAMGRLLETLSRDSCPVSY